MAKAAHSFAEAVQQDPSLLTAQLNEGIALLHSQDLARAKPLLQGVVERDPLCAIDLDRRLLPGETIPEVLAHYQSLLDPMFRAHFEMPILEDEAFETVGETDIVRCALRVSRELALNREPIGVPFGRMPANFLAQELPVLFLVRGASAWSTDRLNTSNSPRSSKL
jgi:hypothetical protein